MVKNKKLVCRMSPSKLDKYLNILEALVLRPQRLDSVAYKANMECRAVKRYLNFLILNGVVEKRELGNRRVYAINERGLAVFKTLRAMKYIQKLKKALPVLEEARQITSVLTQHSRRWKEQ